MECNRDEAERAQSIAVDKFLEKEYDAARKFAVKAQALYPDLKYVSQMISMLDVYIVSAKDGEIDRYALLNVNPSADEKTIKKQFMKLALVHHPDKNLSVGADGAFKIIQESFNILSDQAQRLEYDTRRAAAAAPIQSQQSAQLHAQTAQNQSNGGHQPNGTSKTGSKRTSVPKAQTSGTRKGKKRKPTEKADTFWTTCNHCNFHYEFVMLFLKSKLLCENCKKAFIAEATAPPPGFSPNKVPCQPDDLEKKAPAAKKPRQGPSPSPLEKNVASAESSGTGSNKNAQDPGTNVQGASKSGSNQEKVPHSGTSNVDSRGHRTDVEAARVADGVSKDLKRARESKARVRSQESLKQQKLDAGSRKKTNSMANTNGSVETGSASHTRDFSPSDIRKALMAKSQQHIRIKLEAWKSEKQGFGISTGKNDEHGKSDLSTNASVDKMSTTTTMIVPDPDFHDFDNDRMELSFGDNEVWSSYDDKDGMPRVYALIHKVDSRKPFKLTISWLNSKTNAEFSSMDWVSSGFHKTCGEYLVGKYESVRSINAFSQKVNFSKTKRGSILIFPQKDEVWALYKNWSSGWDKCTPKDVVEKYDMVKVLDDYDEEKGISVAPLVKVVDFKTVFRPELDPCLIKRVSKEEMLRFSHRVPHHVLTGQESQNAPKGYLELDPASTPLELLQVITEANKAVSSS